MPSLSGDLRTLRRLLAYMKPYRSRMVAGLITGAAYGGISGAFPKMVEIGSRRLFDSGQRPPLALVLGMAAVIPAYFAIRGLMSFLNTYCLSWVSGRMLRDLRIELFAHLQRLSLDFFVRQRVSTLIQRVHNNTSAVQGSLVTLAEDVVKQPVTIVVAIVTLAVIDLWFCLFALALGLACLVPMSYFGRKVRMASKAEEKSEGALLGILHESFANVRVIKAYLLERIQEKRFRQAAGRQMSRSMYFTRQRELVSPLIEVVGSFGMAAALIYVYVAQIHFSQFLAVVAGFFMMYDPLKRIGRLHVQTQRMLNRAENVFEVLDTAPAMPDRPAAIELQSFREEIRFEDVSFRYRGRRDVLQEVSLAIPRGSVCALVGPSGAGKTSVVNLLLRFYEPVSGRITIDGHDVADLTLASLRGLIGLVTQDTLLFADSVAENIAYGKPGASREEVVEAAERAHAHEFISTMRNGYDTVLSDRGQNLSGGQAQRIAIARAFLKNPAILILDEATSALDAESERQVQQAMTQLMQDRTVILIAHRLSALRHADQLVVLDRGRVVEIGAHEELLRKDGVYRRLYELQAV